MWNISIDGSKEVWVHHHEAGVSPRVVARFKHASPKASAKHFAKFLEKNFTPAEYFYKRSLGIPPLSILQQKNYVSYNALRVKKEILKEAKARAAMYASFG